MKKKPKKRSTIKSKAWAEFSMFIRLRDAVLTTGDIEQFRCISCGRLVDVKGNHAGHFVPGRHDAVLFHEDIVNGQCRVCNVLRGGEYILYEKALRARYGYVVVEDFKKLRWAIRKYSIGELIEIYEKYKRKVQLILEWNATGNPGLPPGVDERSL